MADVIEAILAHHGQQGARGIDAYVFDGVFVESFFLNNAGFFDIKNTNGTTFESPHELVFVGDGGDHQTGVVFGVGELEELVHGLKVPHSDGKILFKGLPFDNVKIDLFKGW